MGQHNRENSILFRRITIRGFRNIPLLEFEPAERLNVISGNNGQGKTSLLEALYFSTTSRSFRTEQLREMIQEGQDVASVRALIEEGAEHRTQRAVLSASTRSFFIDDKQAERLSSYATRTPVVAFQPGDLALVSGPAASRRRLLDRVGLYLDPLSTFHRHRYQKAQKERQKSLETGGLTNAAVPTYERIMAEHGTALTRIRSLAADQLIQALRLVFSELAASELALDVSYRAGGCADPEEFASELARHRSVDLRSRAAQFGPQKDELELRLDKRSGRHYASQGQQRIMTLALKAAELTCVRQARGVHPVLLLDDVSSELDEGRTDAVYDFLRGAESQIFVTTTRPDLFSSEVLVARASKRSERAGWTVAAGRIARAGPEPA